MAVHVIATRLGVRPGDYAAQRRILSGDGADGDTIRRGLRGLSRESAHLYAYLGRVLVDVVEARGLPVETTTNTTGVQVVRDVGVVVAADFVTLRLECDAYDAGVALVVDTVVGSYTANTLGRAVHTIDVTVTPGAHTIGVAMRMHGSSITEARLYSAAVGEYLMVAGDFP